jgi:hypothetical protein
LKGNLKEISNLVPRETKCPGYEVGKFHNFLKEISVKIRRKKGFFRFSKFTIFTKNAVNAVLEHLGQDPRIPILKYQLNLVPRVLFLRLHLALAGKTLGLSCVRVQGRDARNSYGISFRSHAR